MLKWIFRQERDLIQVVDSQILLFIENLLDIVIDIGLFLNEVIMIYKNSPYSSY